MNKTFVFLSFLIIAISVNPAFAKKRFFVTEQFVSNQVLVKFNTTANKSSQSSILSKFINKFGEGSILSVDPLVTDRLLSKVRLSKSIQIEKAVQFLSSLPGVKYAEPNYIYRALDDNNPTNDPDFGKLWGMQNSGQTDTAGQVGTPGSDVNVVPLWQEGVTGSDKVLVAVIDTGVDWTHPDLVDNLYTNPGEAGELATNGVDDDGNGFIDDVHGWNFVAKNNNSNDDHNHGTHCAGTIGATGNNGIGVVGVNWRVSILPLKFLDSKGSGSLADAVESINYAKMMKANILSNSWGGGGFSQALKDAIVGANEAGILFVAAAGNDRNNNDASPAYPATYGIENIVSVAAIDNKDNIASFSNYGKTTVHVAAPGVKIYSTVKNGEYASYSGTSMATPHVSGIAALLLSGMPELTYADIKERLIKTSVPVLTLKKKTVSKGRVNAYNAFHNIIPPSLDPDESLWKTVEYAVESEHPYLLNQNDDYKISYPGAKYIRVIFEKAELEQKYDYVYIKDGNGQTVEELTGTFAEYTTDYVVGDTLVINLKTDTTINKFGFKVTKYQVITD